MAYSRGSYGGRKRLLKTRTNSSGYQQFKDNCTGQWVLTHRRVAEKIVGGKVYPGREVHYIDGDKSNNRPSNLAILSSAQHRRINRNKQFGKEDGPIEHSSHILGIANLGKFFRSLRGKR